MSDANYDENNDANNSNDDNNNNDIDDNNMGKDDNESLTNRRGSWVQVVGRECGCECGCK